MTREEVFANLDEVFQDVFDDETIHVTDSTTAKDIDGWDSLIHITLIASIEETFDIKLPTKTVINAKTVGELVDSIMESID